MAEAVIFDCRPPLAWISLNRPEKLNAINDDMLLQLLKAFATVEGDARIGAAVLSGRGRAFSAGGDIKAMEAMDQSSFANTISLYMKLALAMRASSKPVVAAIHGYAFAGGFELALLCDVRIAAEDAKFSLPDAALGLSPTSGMTYLLPRIVGLGRALHLTLTGDTIDASEAERIGLVTKVVAPDDLLTTAGAYASRIASHPRIGVANTRAEFYGALDGDFDAAITREYAGELQCFAAQEVKERFRDFLQRKPRRNMR
jgi:enoyl-CoA hydratase/carnithine racemase